jgi:hypothetical protein
MARVYVSSTITDLRRERREVLDWLVAAGHQPVDNYRPDSETVQASSLDDVDTCDLYVLILGHRYGYQPPDGNPDGLSITHLEFRRAGQSHKPRVALLRTSIPDVRLSDMEDPARAVLVMAFRAEVEREVRAAEFQDKSGLIQGLSTGVEAELAKLSARGQGVFLNYRREDTGPYARMLQRDLKQRFPQARVFMDLDSIQAGVSFPTAIRDAVGSSAVLVALIGRQWVTLADEQGRRRLDDPDDYVCFEIRTALAQGVRVIPVLIDGAEPLLREQLPAELEELVQLNAVSLSYAQYDYDAGRLLEQIQQVLPPAGDPAEAGHQDAATAAHPAQEEPEPQALEDAGAMTAPEWRALLTSNQLDVRVRNIYALERSPSDRTVVLEVLAEFVREHSHEPWPLPAPYVLSDAGHPKRESWFSRRFGRPLPQPAPRAAAPEHKTRPDVQAAMTVIGRRMSEVENRVEPVDLKGVDLSGADLSGADLSGADLSGANLSGANLDDAKLSTPAGAAKLSRARLDGASLYRANLNHAQLYEASLRAARLIRADLSGADLTRADLSGADLTASELSGAHLTAADLTNADLAGAVWPSEGSVPEGWARMATSGGLTRDASPPHVPGGYKGI